MDSWALDFLELHPVTILEAAEAIAVDPQVVHEDIRAASPSDEAVALPFPASGQLTRAQDDGSFLYSRSGAGFIPPTTETAV